MRKALEMNTWYCHAFCKIPKVKLICPIGDQPDYGQLEQELINKADKAPTITTHRQMVNMGKKVPGYGNQNLLSKPSKRGASATAYDYNDNQVDLGSSEGQVKING